MRRITTPQNDNWLSKVYLGFLLTVWLILCLLPILYWNELKWYYKLIDIILIWFLMPTLDDFKSLFSSGNRSRQSHDFGDD